MTNHFTVPYKSFLAGDDIEPTPFNGDFTYIEDALNELYGDINDALPLSGGTMTGSIAMGNHKITGLSPGTVSTDAVNKSQLDAKLDLTGGNLAGTLDLGNHKITGVSAGTNPNDVAILSQIVTEALATTGGTMTGDIAMGSNKITGLADGVSSGDAPHIGQFANASGYIDLPNGIQIRYGISTLDISTNIVFTRAFTTQCWFLMTTVKSDTSASLNVQHNNWTAVSTSGFTPKLLGGSGYGRVYIAIGH